MNIGEVKKLIEIQAKYTFHKPDDACKALGYLECYEKSLRLVQEIRFSINGHNPERPLCNSCRDNFSEAILKWEEEA